ncbi:hypothetical protein BDZ45DRAFT_689813 [Acephala macrosclerotiorum]|nr:hypothetical protein BDZ45DRAFT_689813 [Acephala macrosclerotiorum]
MDAPTPASSLAALDTTPSKLRSSLDEPTIKAEYAGHSDNHITFLHPGYDDRSKQSVLLRLQAFDRGGGGLHFGTALAACRIVAGNSKSGSLTRQRDGPKVELQHDELLRHKKYYFYNSDVKNEVYPAYKSFRDWSFPHDDFPFEWSATNTADTDNDNAPPSASGLAAFVSARDKSCRVSESRGADYFESAYLVPRAEADWFEANGMGEYNLSQTLLGDWMLDDVRNSIALRKDIHSAFDDRKFVIVPKQSKWVVQFIGRTNSLGDDFHNTHISLKGVSSQFLYARFAWTIFAFLSSFLNAHISRELLVRLPNGQEAAKKYTFEEIKAEFLPRSRSASPRKRKMTIPEEVQFTTKRVCLERNARRAVGTNQQDNSAYTSLTYTGTSLPGVCSSKSSAQLNIDWQEWIRSRRPSDPSLYCCDYNKAEAESREGIPGKPEWGGAYLCDQCRVWSIWRIGTTVWKRFLESSLFLCDVCFSIPEIMSRCAAGRRKRCGRIDPDIQRRSDEGIEGAFILYSHGRVHFGISGSLFGLYQHRRQNLTNLIAENVKSDYVRLAKKWGGKLK